MKLGVIADDFTGASDIALTLSDAGMRTVQYVGVPESDADSGVAAGVVALKSRTIAASDAVTQSLAACEWLLAQGVEQIVFKVCSTFDSTADGNIGPVAEALADRLDENKIIVCPAFPETGRSVYNGHLFVNDVLLSESGMQNHPLTPMVDADIRRVLASQASASVGHIPAVNVLRGASSIAGAILAADENLLIVDAIRDEDLLEIGAAAKGRKLLVGGSGIALGLPANFQQVSKPEAWIGATGSAVVLSGSCSIATREQVKTYAADAPSVEISASSAMAGSVDISALSDWVMAQEIPPLIYSSADPEIVKAAQEKYGRERSANAIEAVFSDLAGVLLRRGVRRFVVAGGETSGAVTSGLSASALEIGPKIAAGVPCLKIVGQDIALALKSGNFGDSAFFAKALKALGAQSGDVA